MPYSRGSSRDHLVKGVPLSANTHRSKRVRHRMEEERLGSFLVKQAAFAIARLAEKELFF